MMSMLWQHIRLMRRSCLSPGNTQYSLLIGWHYVILISDWLTQHLTNLWLFDRYESEIASLHQEQFREFRSWVMTVHEEYKTTNNIPVGSFPRSDSSFSMSSQQEMSALQESFTITLGAQMKQMHNLRVSGISCLWLVDICKYLSLIGWYM